MQTELTLACYTVRLQPSHHSYSLALLVGTSVGIDMVSLFIHSLQLQVVHESITVLT